MIGRKGSCVYWRPSKAAQKQARPESVIRKRSNCTTLLTNGRDVAELEDAEAAIASLEAASQSPHLRDCIHSDSVPNSRKSEVKRQLSFAAFYEWLPPIARRKKKGAICYLLLGGGYVPPVPPQGGTLGYVPPPAT